MSVENARDGNVQKYTSPRANLFALYPQIKGMPDYGFKEFNNNPNNYFSQYDLTGKTTPRTYVLNVISKILEDYFNSNLPLDVCPQVILEN